MFITVQEAEQKLGKKACKDMQGETVNLPYLIEKGTKVAVLRRHVSGYTAVEDEVSGFIVTPIQESNDAAGGYDFEVRYVLKNTNIRFVHQSDDVAEAPISLTSGSKTRVFFNQDDLKKFFKRYCQGIEAQREAENAQLDKLGNQIDELSL